MYLDGDYINFIRLKGMNRRIACYVSVGSLEDWRDDFKEFPADAVGAPLGDWEGENYIDITNPVRTGICTLV